jgi:hypothetical protein
MSPNTPIIVFGALLAFGIIYRWNFENNIKHRLIDKDMETKLKDLTEDIKMAYDNKGLNDIQNDVIDFHRKFRKRKPIKAYSGKLMAQIENKRSSFKYTKTSI